VALADAGHRHLQHLARDAVGTFLGRPTGAALEALRSTLDRLIDADLDRCRASGVEQTDRLALEASHERLRTGLDQLVRARPGTGERTTRGHALRHRLLAHLDVTTEVARRHARTPEARDEG
jgi:hypothetical protein